MGALEQRPLPDIGGRIRTQEHEPRDVKLAALRNRLVKRYVRPAGPDECWEWRGRVEPDGYSRINWGHSKIGGHRAAYMAFVQDVPEGMVLDHLCRNRKCVNPAHLEPVTNAENVLRGGGLPAVLAGRTECAEGHPFEGDNLSIWRKRDGSTYRACKACHRAKWHRLRAQKEARS